MRLFKIFKNKKVIVTGHTGFKGSWLTLWLLKLGANVMGISKNIVTNPSHFHCLNLKEKILHRQFDIKDLKKLEESFKKFQPSFVFHLAAQSLVRKSYNFPIDTINSNTIGTLNVLEYARKYNIPIVYAGSSTRLASEGPGHSPYSYFKSCTVDLLKNYNRWYGVRYNVCYFYNVYGELQDTCNNGWETVISIFEKQYKSNKPLTVVGDGKQRRDFTYVGDIVNGLIKASLSFKQEEYQLGSGKDYSILEVARLFSDNITFIKSRPGDRKKGKANVEETFTKLNWKPKGKLTDWISKVKKNT